MQIPGKSPVGISSHLERLTSSNLNRQLDLMQRAGIQWVRQEFVWSTIHPSQSTWDFSKYDPIISGILSRGMSIIGLLSQYNVPSWYGTPSNKPPAPQDYASWASVVASRYTGQIPLYEIGNEPNFNSSWYPNASASAYTAFLKAAYSAIKTADPNAEIMSAGLASTGDILPEPFLIQMYQAGAQGYMDYVGHHPYSWPKSPDYTGGTPMFIELLDLYQIMIQNGDGNKQIIVSEVGWPTYSGGVTEATQASYIQRVYQKILYEDFQYVAIACIYDFLNDGTDPNNPEHNFGLLHNDYSLKPAYNTVKQILGTKIYVPRVFGGPVYAGTGLTRTSQSVSLTETFSQTNAVQQNDTGISLSETTTLSTNLLQIATDTVQISETNPVCNLRSKYALRAFGAPVRYVNTPTVITENVLLSESVSFVSQLAPDIVSRYVLRAFGAPIRRKNPFIVSLAEQVNLLGLSQQSTEAVQISDTSSSSGIVAASQSGAFQLQKYALRVFGGAAKYSRQVSTDVTSLSDSVILASVKIDLVVPAESVTIAELISLAGNSSTNAETVSLTEGVAQAGSPSISDSVQLSDNNPSLQTKNKYALRAFGSPVKYGNSILVIPADSVSLSETIISRKKYALRVFGSAIKIGVVSNTMRINETTPISEIASLTSATTLSAELVSISEKTPSLAGLPSFSDMVQILDTMSEAGQLQFSESVQASENSSTANSMSIPAESIGIDESLSLLAMESIDPELVQILEILSASGSPSFTEAAQISDATSSQASSTIAAEAISLSDLTAQTGSSSLQSEVVSISDTTSQSLLMAINESAQISEQTSFATNTSFIEQTTINDVLALLGLPQFNENVQIAENASQAGQPQFIDNVQLLENAGIAGVSTIAGETALVSEQSALTGLPQIIEVGTQLSDALTSLFGSLTNIIQIKKYASRTFGAPVRYNASSSTDVISPAETPSLAGSGAISAEAVSLADISAQNGLSAFTEAVPLTETSSQSGLSSTSEAASLQEVSSLAGAGNISPEAASLSDFSTQTGLSAFAEAASPNDALSLASSSLIIEIILISESSSLAGSGQIIEIIPIIDINPSLSGSSQTSEAIQLADLLSLVGLPNLTESIQLGDLAFFINTTQNIDFSPISELTSLSSSQFIVDTSQLQLSDFLSLSNLSQFVDNVQILEIASLVNSYHVFIIARGRDGIAIVSGRDGMAIAKGK